MTYTVRYLEMAYPALGAEHISSATLFANRFDLVRALNLRTKGRVAEVGVALGDFSEFLLDTLRPLEFVAIDTFALHTSRTMNGAGGGVDGQPTLKFFGGRTHADYYRDRFSSLDAVVNICNGNSAVCLSQFNDGYFDFIYIDADHSYEAVKADAEVAVRKVAGEGILMFNDYIMFDHVARRPYGVIPVVNDLVVNRGWTLVGFALHDQMFCDVALTRRADKSAADPQ